MALQPAGPPAPAAARAPARFGDVAPGARRPRLRGRQAADRPAARPGARRRRAARHGHLPAHLRPPVPRRAVARVRRDRRRSSEAGIDLDLALAGGYDSGARRRADRVDDRLVAAHRIDRDRPRPDRPARAVPPPDVRHAGRRRRRRRPRRRSSRRRAGDRHRATATRRSRWALPARRARPRARWCRSTRPLALMRQMDDDPRPDRASHYADRDALTAPAG